MKVLNIYALKLARKLYFKFFSKPEQVLPESELNPDIAAEIIYNRLVSTEPCMVARWGSTELMTVVEYLGIQENDKDITGFIKGEKLGWWWNGSTLKQMQKWSGFFPPTTTKIEQFCKLMLEDIKYVDVLGSWLYLENKVKYKLNSINVHLRLLEPFWAGSPWTRALEGKKVLVVHPFKKTIIKQYAKRDLLFSNRSILPTFGSLEVIQAVQSIGKEDSRFVDWFDALNYMKCEIDKIDYDICLIGAGAYGFPLAAHVKRSRRKAVHMGGALQLLFGIRGKRWEDSNYGVKEWQIPVGSYKNLMNEHWVRPDETEKPQTADAVEGACYW
jgi:hypothetical protein